MELGMFASPPVAGGRCAELAGATDSDNNVSPARSMAGQRV